MKSFYTLLLLLVCSFSFSQVGINTTAPDAQLDIRSINPASPAITDGILIPKVNNLLAVPTTAQNGMMVFLTANLPGKPIGFYYWDDASTSWKGIGGNKGWDLPGNVVSDTLKFVGSTNSTDLIFKSDNHRGGRIGTTNTSIGRHALNPMTFGTDNSAFGKNALNANANATGNSGFGVNSLKATTDGNNNTASGSNSLATNTTGGENTAMGFNALFLNSGGFANTAVGSQSLYATTGSNNVGIGYFSGNNITTGSGNIAIGLTAQVAAPTGNAQLSIGNVIYGTDMGSATLGKIGIGMTTPAARLQVASPFNPALPANTDGIIIPRVSALAPVASMTAAQNGMMVFLTAPAAQAGFYYWDLLSNSWKGFGASLAAGTAIGNTTYWNGTKWVENSNNLFNNGTNVGIGIVPPTEKFQVNANMKVGADTWTSAANDKVIKFGDGDYVSVGEQIGDDMMVLKAMNFIFMPSPLGGYTGNVGIGTTAPGEKLDVAGKTKTTTFQMTTAPAAAALMVSDATGNGSWQNPNTALNAFAWKTTGNALLTNPTHFLGTTDNVDLIFKRNGIQAGKLSGTNTSFGVNALKPTTAGTGSTALGAAALFLNEGNNNTGVGYLSMQNNGTGANNTAVGYTSMSANTTGGFNIAVGGSALLSNTSGYNNTALGHSANRKNLDGYMNTSVGLNAAWSGIHDFENTALGYQALYSNDGGNQNTAVGAWAAFNATGFGNSSCLGYGSAFTASNQIRIGNIGVTSVGAQMGWTTVSDRRFKKDVVENVPGLDFIKKLRPVTYHMDIAAIAGFMKTPDSLRSPGGEALRAAMLQTGFIAQEVEAAAKELNYDFSGVDKPKNSTDYYGLRYAEFVVPLVKAVQEQQQIIEAEKAKNAQLQEEINTLKTNQQALEQRLKNVEERLNKF